MPKSAILNWVILVKQSEQNFQFSHHEFLYISWHKTDKLCGSLKKTKKNMFWENDGQQALFDP